MTLIPFFIFIALLICGILLPKTEKIKESAALLKLAKILPNALAICTLVITLLFAVPDVLEYKTLMTSVTEETMLISEGVVSEYKILENGHETFKIGDTEFEIIPHKFNYGYNTALSDGSVIKEGENLKIGYVDYKGERKIVYIEKIVPEE